MHITKCIMEMSKGRSAIIDTCRSLGELFIEHFHKIYDEGVYGEDFPHHCAEMQAWFDKCSGFTFKPSTRQLKPSEKIAWFFKAGGNLDASQGFTNSVEKRTYILFCEELMSCKDRDLQEIAEYSLTVGVAPNEPTKYDWK